MKEETLEEAAERNYNEAGVNAYFNNGFIRGAKWQQENSYNDKKEFAISFSRFLELLKINHPELYWSKNVDELIEIYQDENRG